MTEPETSVETAIATIEEQAVEPTKAQISEKDVFVFATNPAELSVAQTKLIEWAKRRIEEEKVSLKDLEENLAIAKKNKWRTTALQNAVSKAKKTIVYYDKMQKILEAGYCMVPEMNIELFAIRTTKELPKGQATAAQAPRYYQPLLEQSSDSPPAGVGEYVSNAPQQAYDHSIVERDGKKFDQYHWFADEHGEIDFPFKFAKPEILKLTVQAMQAKLFDEIGVLPRTRAADPMVIGRISIGKGKGWRRTREKSMNFVIAWFIDSKDL